MKGLLIRDPLRWHDDWSAQIGRQLKVHDSTNDLFIFDDRYARDDILKVIGDVPEDLYQLFDLEDAPELDCDYQADSGRCYRRSH